MEINHELNKQNQKILNQTKMTDKHQTLTDQSVVSLYIKNVKIKL